MPLTALFASLSGPDIGDYELTFISKYVMFLSIYFAVPATMILSHLLAAAQEKYHLLQRQKIESARKLEERARMVERQKVESARKLAERTRLIEMRDADVQDTAYRYEIGRHARETLALRYGIPHVNQEYGQKGRELDTILIRKIRSLEADRYEVILPEYRDRKAIAVIEKGTEYVKTFYPQDGSKWWDRNGDWEEVLKGNSGFTIKDMARMHIERLNQRS